MFVYVTWNNKLVSGTEWADGMIIILFQRQDKYTDNKLKALKARNEYLLSIEAANTATNKYFVDDVSLLIEVTQP